MINSGIRSIAAFDFDGTLTRRDSLFPFLLYALGTLRFTKNTLQITPILSAYAVGWLKNDVAKKKVLQHFIGGRDIEEIESLGIDFAAKKLPKLLHPKAINRLKWHKRQGHECILVSASLIHYLRPWAKSMGFDHVIASQLEVDGNKRVTGSLLGENCYGQEKARRLKELLSEGDPYLLYAYGDSRGDKEMLAMADYAFYRTMPTKEEI